MNSFRISLFPWILNSTDLKEDPMLWTEKKKIPRKLNYKIMWREKENF